MKSSKNSKIMSRRNFMVLAGGAAGMATMAAAGIFTADEAFCANIPEIDYKKIKSVVYKTDVLVIGGGMAGLFAAVKGHDAGAKVLLISKGRLGASGQTPFAKGFFAYNPETAELNLDEFVAAVSRSALGTNNPVYTRQMAELSLSRSKELKEWGFFESNLYNESFRNPIDARNIPVKERVIITHLIKENGRVCGAAGFSQDNGEVLFCRAKSVILCTGAGGFKPNGFPICDLTHDGTVMAYNIGAKVTGKEWNDGHLGHPEHPAACYDGWGDMFSRKPSINGVDIHHDLGVELNYEAYRNGNPVEMGPPGARREESSEDGPYTPDEFLRSGPPGGGKNQHGRPPKREGEMGHGRPPGGKGGPAGMAGVLVGGASAGMAIHKSEGLVPVNDKCESNIPGLYAAGDALGSYMAGAIYTQIGSSLAGSAVQGGVAGEAAAAYCRGLELPEISTGKMKEVQDEILAPLKKEKGYSPAWVTQTLQSIMIPNFVLYIKKERLLEAALAYIEELRDHHMPMLKAANLHELRLVFETANMITSAEMKLRASLMRKESRCSHYRLDYPKMDTKNWNAWINIYKGADGSMKFEKQPFGS